MHFLRVLISSSQKDWFLQHVLYFLDLECSISPYSVRMQENTDQKKLRIWTIFTQCPEKMVFPKNLHWNMIFLALSGKMIFLFPKNLMLLFRQKVKDDFSQKKKKKEKYEFLQRLQKDSLSKQWRWNMILLVSSEKYDV